VNKLYDNKKFFIKKHDGTLDGPREDIYYANIRANIFQKIMNFIQRNPTYKFIQVIDGKPIQAFYADEIMVVTDGE
jgi:hypothetical protein